MSSVIQRLHKKGLLNSPPPFVVGATQYEVLMGSEAYGVSSGDSDRDVYGFCIPPKTMVFPHLAGDIQGFGTQKKGFEQFEQHHCMEDKTQWDMTIYGIVKYFHLCMGCNPNMIDSLFVPDRCVFHITSVGQIVRDNRHLFLSKKAWHTFKGYAYAQMHKMRTKKPKPGSTREKSVQEHGFDVKYAYHIVRLLNEVEEILSEGTLTLGRNREQLKAIRRGEWTLQEVEEYFSEKESSLETLYNKSDLQYGPDEEAIKRVLVQCLERHYGDVDNCVQLPDQELAILRQIDHLLEPIRQKL